MTQPTRQTADNSPISRHCNPSNSNCCNYIVCALGIIILVGSVVTACSVYSLIGNWSFALGGGGIILGLGLLILNQCFHKEELHTQSVLRDQCLANDDLHLYIAHLATQYPKLGIPEIPQIYTIPFLRKQIFEILPAEIENYHECNLPIYLRVMTNDKDEVAHWTLVYIDRERRTIEYYDSKKNYGNYRQIVKELKTIGELLSAEDPENEPYKFISKINKTIQRDGYNCGPWLLYFLEERLKNPDVNFNQLDMRAAQQIIRDYRAQVESVLIDLRG